MNYSQALQAFYDCMGRSTYDEKAIIEMMFLRSKIEDSIEVSRAQTMYLHVKIDNFAEFYYNEIRSLAFFHRNNNFKTSSNYAKFILCYTWALPPKLQQEAHRKLVKSLQHQKNTATIQSLHSVLKSFSISI